MTETILSYRETIGVSYESLIATITAIVAIGLVLNEASTIQLKRQTKRRLDELGRKGETYDDIVRELIRVYEKTIADSKLSEDQNQQATRSV